MKSYTDLYKDIIVPIVSKHISDATIILYGSRARADEGEGSDIDLALDCKVVIDSKVLNAIKEDVHNSNVPVEVDVVDLQAVSDRLQKEIKKDGIIWKK